MRSHRVISAVAILGVVLGAVSGSWSQDANPVSSSGTASVGAYPESGEGLSKLVEDMFAAVRSKDDAKISSYVSALAIPDHGAWFAKTFGGTEGARMEAKYIQLLPSAPKNIRNTH
jgi:hypothetical protein